MLQISYSIARYKDKQIITYDQIPFVKVKTRTPVTPRYVQLGTLPWCAPSMAIRLDYTSDIYEKSFSEEKALKTHRSLHIRANNRLSSKICSNTSFTAIRPTATTTHQQGWKSALQNKNVVHFYGRLSARDIKCCFKSYKNYKLYFEEKVTLSTLIKIYLALHIAARHH